MSPSATKITPPSTDPIVYDVHHQTFAGAGLPKNEAEWVERAARVGAILAEDVSVRDREQKIPAAEVSLLKSAGLLKVLGPSKYGGGGQPWNVAYKVIREVAKSDGSLGEFIRYTCYSGMHRPRIFLIAYVFSQECFSGTTFSGRGPPTSWERTSKQTVGKSTSLKTTLSLAVRRRLAR
jgi:hypothetical protein